MAAAIIRPSRDRKLILGISPPSPTPSPQCEAPPWNTEKVARDTIGERLVALAFEDLLIRFSLCV